MFGPWYPVLWSFGIVGLLLVIAILAAATSYTYKEPFEDPLTAAEVLRDQTQQLARLSYGVTYDVCGRVGSHKSMVKLKTGRNICLARAACYERKNKRLPC